MAANAFKSVLDASLLSYGARPENAHDLVFELAAEPGNASLSVRSSRLARLGLGLGVGVG